MRRVGSGQAIPAKLAATLRPLDDELVRAARDGDAAALERLLRRHEGTVLRVLRLLGVDAGDREDVAQEVLVRVFRYLDRYRPGRSFSAWVYRITVNAAHDFRVRQQRHRREERALRSELEREEGSGPAAESEGGRRALRQLLESALSVLSERERAVFVLRELEGLSTHEVARSLGISGITVRRHLGRARSRLQRRLGGAGGSGRRRG